MRDRLRALVAPDRPCLGLRSELPAPSIPDGALEDCRNVRIRSGTVYARNGAEPLTHDLPEGSYRGHAHVVLDGQDYLAVAYAIDGLVRVAVSPSPLDGGEYTEITSADGPFGPTRMSDVGRNVSMYVVRDRPRAGIAEFDCLVIQNGLDDPRVWARQNADSRLDETDATYRRMMSIVRQPPAGDAGGKIIAEHYFPKWLDLSDAAGYDLVAVDSTDTHLYVNQGTGIIWGHMVTGDTADSESKAGNGGTYTFDTPVDLTGATQLVIGATWSDYRMWTNGAPDAEALTVGDLEISIGDGAETYTLWAGAGDEQKSFCIQEDWEGAGVIDRKATGTSGRQHVTWVLDVSDLGAVDRTAVNSVTIVSTDAVKVSREMGLKVRMIAAGGDILGTCDAAVSFASGDARTEGVAGLSSTKAARAASEMGGIGTKYRVPLDERIRYSVRIRYPISDVIGSGIDRVHFYLARSTFDGQAWSRQTDYYWVGTEPIALYSGGAWSLTTTPDAQGLTNWTVPATAEQDYSRPRLRPGSYVLPAGKATASMGGRIFVANGAPRTLDVETLGIYEAYQRIDIITKGPHGLSTGDTVVIRTLVGPASSIDGVYTATVVNPVKIEIPYTGEFLFDSSASNRTIYAPPLAENRLWISQYERPWVFRRVANPDDDYSATSLIIDGEDVQALVPTGIIQTSGESVGSPLDTKGAVFILTRSSISYVQGTTARSLAQRVNVKGVGTDSPRSVVRAREGFYFLSNECQAMKWSGSDVVNLSRGYVGDRLAGIPEGRVGDVVGAYANDRYYLGYTPEDGTLNTKVLVLDEVESARTGEPVWVEDDLEDESADGLKVWRKRGRSRLVAIDADLSMFEHDAAGSDGDWGGSSVSVMIRPREVSEGPLTKSRVGGVHLWCSPTDGTATVSREARGDSSSAPAVDRSTLSTERGGDRRSVLFNGAAAAAEAVSIVLEADVPSGWSVFGLFADSSPSGTGGR